MNESDSNNFNSANFNSLKQQHSEMSSLGFKTTNSSQEQVSKLETTNGHSTSIKMGDLEPQQHCNGKSSEENINILYLVEDDLQLFEHQVSGHGSAEKGLLKHKNGCILKPLQVPPMGAREVNFYQHIYENRSPQQEDCYIKLKPFVPNFQGVACLKNSKAPNGNGNREVTPQPSQSLQRYLLLEDIIEGFKKPCVADIKIGPCTWSPGASEAKIKQESSKYKGTKFPLGLCLTGMLYYDILKQENCKKTKDFCKLLEPLTLQTSLEDFFNKNNSDLYRNLVSKAIEKMRNIEDVFSAQKTFKLYGSSILVAYDAEYFESEVANNADTSQIPLRVFMIDFAHFHPSDEESLDDNYLFGLRNFIKILCDIAGEPVMSQLQK